MFNRRFFIVIFTLFITISLLSCQEATQAVPSNVKLVKEVQKAPDFKLNDLNGNEFSLSSTKGKVVILDFFETGCPPCKAEVPDFQDLYEAYKDKGLEIVGISLDQGGAGEVKVFAEQYGVTYSMVMGNSEVVNKYGGIRFIPTTFVLDREGNIVVKAIGYRPKAFFEETIKALL